MSPTDARVARDRGGREAAALFGGVPLLLRRLRFEPGQALTMLVLVGGTCFLFAALPRLFNNFADDGLRYTVGHAAPLARNVRALERDRIPAGGDPDPLARVTGRAARSQQALPTSLRELIERRTFVVRSPRYIHESDRRPIGGFAQGLFRYLRLRLQSGVDARIRLVAGRLPSAFGQSVSAPVARPVDPNRPEPSIPGLPRFKEVPLVEVALSTTTARLLLLHVGDRAVFTPDLTDTALERVPIRDQQPLAIKVTGLFVVKNPNAPYWFGDRLLGTPEVRQSQTLDEQNVFAEALVSPSAYATALAATRPLQLTYEYRYFVDAGRLDSGQLGGLGGDLAQLDARYAGAGPLEPRVETGLAAVLDRYRAARSQGETLLAVAAIGLLACALASLGLLGTLSYERRRGETAVSRTRGASPLHLLAAQAAEALLIALPAGLAGWAVATLVIDARWSSLSAWFALAVVAGAAVPLTAAIAGLTRRPLRPPGRDDVVLQRSSPRRLAIEGLVAVASGLGVYLLRRRGLGASNADGFDPYLAGVPVLLGLACGIVALRLYPLPLAGAARLARRGRSLVLHLGLSRAARRPDITAAPLLALLLALAIATFSAAMLSTLEAGQDRAGWRVIGADLRVDAPVETSLPERLVSRLDSTGVIARAYVQEALNAVAGLGGGVHSPLLVALDLPAYERAVAGTPAAVRFPRELTETPPIAGVGPALVSVNWPTGSLFRLQLPDGTADFLSVADRASFPGIPQGTPFAIVSLAEFQRQAGGEVLPNRLYVRGTSAAAVRQAVHDTGAQVEIESRAAVASSLRASPLIEGVLRGFRAAIVLAGLYAAVAVGLLALIAARSLARDLALLRTMGISQRESSLLAAVELAPFGVVALALGVGLGVAIPYLVAPGLDLAFFTGSGSNPISIPILRPAAVAAGVLVLIAAAIVLAGVRMRRTRLDRVLRIGES